MGINRSIDFLPDAEHLSAVHKSVFGLRLHGHMHSCPVQAHSSVSQETLWEPNLAKWEMVTSRKIIICNSTAKVSFYSRIGIIQSGTEWHGHDCVVQSAPTFRYMHSVYSLKLAFIVPSGNRTPGSQLYSDLVDSWACSVSIHQLVVKPYSNLILCICTITLVF